MFNYMRIKHYKFDNQSSIPSRFAAICWILNSPASLHSKNVDLAWMSALDSHHHHPWWGCAYRYKQACSPQSYISWEQSTISCCIMMSGTSTLAWQSWCIAHLIQSWWHQHPPSFLTPPLDIKENWDHQHLPKKFCITLAWICNNNVTTNIQEGGLDEVAPQYILIDFASNP